MRSLADRARVIAERAARADAFAALAILLWRALRPPPPSGVEVAGASIEGDLGRWTTTAPAEIHVRLDAAPSPLVRDWLRALSRSGTRTHWSAARPLRPAAIVAEPTVEPDGGTRVRLASAVGEPVSIGDAAGLIDSLTTGGNAELELASVEGDLRARGTTYTASTIARDTIALRPVLVLGVASWESKFTIAALEERGWRVASRLRVAPGVEITQGPLGAIDTSRYAAVVALDTSAAPSADAIARYARSGGGVVLAANTARLASLSGIAAGSVGARVAGIAGAVASAAPRTGLGVFPVAAARSDAVPLERRSAAVTVAARRVDAGRVVQTGYDETWRWRMSGGEEAVAAHREWWSRLVSAVAYAPLVRRASTGDVAIDETPLASLIDAVGPATALDAAPRSNPDRSRTTRLLFAIVVGALLLEWASRRLRGAR
jgi:hypothetical protein